MPSIKLFDCRFVVVGGEWRWFSHRPNDHAAAAPGVRVNRVKWLSTLSASGRRSRSIRRYSTTLELHFGDFLRNPLQTRRFPDDSPVRRSHGWSGRTGCFYRTVRCWCRRRGSGFDRLAVAHQAVKRSPQTVDRFPRPDPDAQKVIAVGIGCPARSRCFQLAAGNTLAVAQKSSAQISPLVTRALTLPLFQLNKICCFRLFSPSRLQNVQRIVQTVIQRPLKMLDAHPDNPPSLWGKKRTVNIKACQAAGTFTHVTGAA